MDFAFSRFERLLSRPMGVVPDFAVLLAGLSARQSVSATARVQTMLDHPETRLHEASIERVALFADGNRLCTEAGASFSQDVMAQKW